MLLQLEGLSVRFGGVEALTGVDLRLAPGQALGLVGANGCGKTTLFNAITGVVRASAGRILFLARDITAAAVHDIARAGIARTFQTVRLFPTMTVGDNVARVDEAGAAESVEQALEQTGLNARRNVLAAELSLAEQRRLEIARALARAPKLLLMDEPTSGLSPQETDDMIGLLAQTRAAGTGGDHRRAQAVRARCALPTGRSARPGTQGEGGAASRAVRRASTRLCCSLNRDGEATSHAKGCHCHGGDRGPRRSARAGRRPRQRRHRLQGHGQTLVYDCIIKLSNARTSAPLEQAAVIVGADMPSMPMAHNVRPVIAKATGTPGEYQARLTLEMHGDWAVRLKIEGPLRDQLVQMKSFSEAGSGPPRRKSGAPRGSGHKH